MTPGTEIAESYGQLLLKTLPRSIRNEAEAARLQQQIDRLIDKVEPLTEAELELLSLLGDLIHIWEGGKYDLPDISGPEAIRELLIVHGLRQRDLVGPIFPTESVASEVLSGKRLPTYDHVAKLATYFNVSPALFYPGKSPAE